MINNCRIALAVIIFILFVFADLQGQDTLRHIDKNEKLYAYTTELNSKNCGYLSGQNCYGWEKYAEKYLIKGRGSVAGVEIYFAAKIKNAGRSLAIDIYSVGSNGFPQDTLGRKLISYRNLVGNGYPCIVKFDAAVNVNTSFFIGINFLNYAHEAFSDTIAIQTSGSFSRPARDLEIPARNVVQPHHGKFTDFYELSKVRAFLAIHPIGNLQSDELIQSDSLTGLSTSMGSGFYSFFPNPVKDMLTIALEPDYSMFLNFRMFDVLGTEINKFSYGYDPQKNSIAVSTNLLQNGMYIFSVQQRDGIFTGMFLVNKN